MARKSFKAGALTAPLPPVMVTVGRGDEANIITIAWTGILSTIPPRTYISVRPERHSYKLLRREGEFVINLPTADMARTVDYVGIYTGAKVDKFAECGLGRVESEVVSAPTIAECPLALECRVCEVIPMGTHDVFIADIVSVSCDESIMDENGKICFERANLLAYMHGEYYSLGEKVGKFGFSATKKERGKNAPKKRKSDTSDGKTVGEVSGEGSSTKRGKRTHGEDSEGRGRPKKAGAGKGAGDAGPTVDGGKRPFYLTAPRGKRNKGGRRK